MGAPSERPAPDTGVRANGRCATHLGAGRRLEERRDLLPGDRGAGQMPHPRRELVKGPIGQEHATQADGERGRRAVTGDEGGSKPEQAQEEPAARHHGDQPRGRSIHRRRALQIACQGLILAVMPALAPLLRQARAVAHQAFHQVMRQRQPFPGPVAALPPVPPAEEQGHGHPREQEEGVPAAPRARMQDRGGDEQLHPRHEPEQPAAQGERFHRLGLEDTPEELTGALMAHLLRRKPQGPSRGGAA